MKKPPCALVMWAICCVGDRRDGIVNCTVARTRRESWKRYGEMWQEPEKAIRRAKRKRHCYPVKVRVEVLA